MFKSTVEVEGKEGYVKDYLTEKLVRAGPEELDARQIFEKRLVEEYGYLKNQISGAGEEFYIQKGSNEKVGPADIVVFKDDKRTKANIKLIVETKRKDRKDGRDQLKSYVYPTPAEGAVWFNGTEIAYFRVIRKPPSYGPELVKWRNIPKKGQTWEEIGKYKKLDELSPDPNLKSPLKVIYYHLYTNSNLPRAERLGAEMTRLIFCKIYDELHNSKDLKFKAGAEESDGEIANRIKNLFEKVKEKGEYEDVFSEEERLLLDDRSIAYVVSQLENKSLLKTDKDAVGDAFEVFIGPGLRGEKGQFFTPRGVVRMTIEMLNPKPNEKIIDPACGSGGFLIVALEHVWKEIEEQYTHLSKERIGGMKADVASRSFYGIDKEFDLAKVSKAYMAIVGDGRGGIFCADSLVNPSKEWDALMREKTKLGSFDVLMTNPPFGAKIPVTGEELLSQYELGYKWKLNRETGEWTKTNKIAERGIPPQILFIERCLQLLKPGGRMAIVLPDGILGNVNDGYIRQFILDEAKILAIVDCPTETFQPSTSTKTSVLFLQKKKEGEIGGYPVFMAAAEKCGHDRRGKTVYKIDEKGREIIDDDLPIIAKQ